ncbi:ABC transporter substrate-binding protein [Sulfitobacter sp. EhC04]|uniref:ABC transporter substrate-binding protein n=1 Tax=Sulfitobacter sp. EhC04 TaxID=1849168 RepID=UPI0009EED274|nr:ABC transporter substrate-binding protein [Sulfitobacter sp. EhC04]
MKLTTSAAAIALLFAVTGATADTVKIGFISTMSGPLGGTGNEASDGFKLFLDQNDGKMGGAEVEMHWEDDQAKPDVSRQAADKLISEDVDIFTGIIFSNVLLSSIKPILDSGAFYISNNAAPSQIAGKLCDQNFFAVSHQNDQLYEGLGVYMQEMNFDNVYLMAPNYPAGKDMMAGFKRHFQGKIAGEVYTAFGQLDYSAEIAQVRAAAPSTVVFFYPGGMGINFVKQYQQSGLMGEIPVYTGSHGIDQSILPAVGDAAIGVNSGAIWSEFGDNEANRVFVEGFEKAYGRIPSPYAAMAYDTARVIDAALTEVGGSIEDRDAFRTALETMDFSSIRGNFKFNTNHMPIMDYYMTVVEKDAQGRLVNALKSKVASDLEDGYVSECKISG